MVQRTNVVIRASDRVVGGRERVEDYGVSPHRAPAVVDDDDPIGAPACDPAETDPVEEPERGTILSEGMRGLIELVRTAVRGEDIDQDFNASAAGSAAPIQVGRADERPEAILNYSQRQILKLRKVYKLNLSATNAIMTLVQDPSFNPSELGTDRVQTLERVLLRGHGGGRVSEYDCHREGNGNQDLKMYTRDCKQVASEIFSDPRFKRALTFNFVPTFDDEGRRTFGSAMGGVWAQFHARVVIDGVEVLLVLAIYIDASYVKVNLTVKPIYCTYCIEFQIAQAVTDFPLRNSCSDFAQHQRKQAVQGRSSALFGMPPDL